MFAFPFLVPSHSAVIPVNPAPFPTNDPENVDPDMASTFVKSTTAVDPDTVNDPVMFALPR